MRIKTSEPQNTHVSSRVTDMTYISNGYTSFEAMVTPALSGQSAVEHMRRWVY